MTGAMAPVVRYPITVPQALAIRVEFVDDAGAPLDLTGATWDVDVRAVPAGTRIASFTVDTSDQAGGVVTLLMPANDSSLIRTGMRSTLYRMDTDTPVLTIRWEVTRSFSDGVP